MKPKLSVLLLLLLACTSAFSYTSPGTSQKLTLDNLVALSGGEVTFAGDYYSVNANITISTTDTLSITSDAIIKFAVSTSFTINGVLIINPPTGVLFTAQSVAAGYNGVQLLFSNASKIRKLTFEYAISFRITDSSPIIDSCVFQYNNVNNSTTYANGAMALARGNPTITNSKFINNNRAAIQGGANVTNTPKIYNCLFQGNNSATTSSLPQINLGAAGSITDSCKIMYCRFEQSSIGSGAIGFLPLGDVYAVVHGNVIRKNRYGITFNGGSNINARVTYNIIDSNRIQNDPNLGGSGIAFTGGSSTSHQKVIVTGNLFRWNLYGITIQPNSQGGAMPNLGNLTNADTSDDGKNQFLNNNNAVYPQADLYNNTVEDIFAQGNYWGTDDPVLIENKIFHKPDQASLGLVNYSLYLVPIELQSFTAHAQRNAVELSWKTSTEVNSDHFIIEKSNDGLMFYSIGRVAASGNSNLVKSYLFTDNDIAFFNRPAYYRLKLVDKDGRYKYSQVVSVTLKRTNDQLVNLYSSHFTTGEVINAKIVVGTAQQLAISIYSAEGKLITTTYQQLQQGDNTISFTVNDKSPAGIYFIKFSSIDIRQTVPVIKQ